MKKIIFIYFTTLTFSKVFSQNQTKDTLKTKEISEIVVTAQFEPQSIKKSVYNVRVITQADIQNLAANNLADVLNQYLNIMATPNSKTGRSTVSMFGLDAQYFKILVDNVPLANEGGLGNNTDLSQINLNDIEKIEIVEGSMGVTHGANAVSGILNIITKKSSSKKWNIHAVTQQESIGSEFSLLKEGRYIQSLKIDHNFNSNWFISTGINHNNFQGLLSDKKGQNYIENDQTRGYRWLPKEQWNGSGLLAYKKNDFRAFYKFEILDEIVNYYNATVQSGYNDELGSYRYANDKNYLTQRFFHHANASGKLFQRLNFNVSVSQQEQKRIVEDYRYILSTRKESNNSETKDQGMKVLYSTGTLSNFFKSSIFSVQLGYEAVHNTGFALVQEANSTFKPIEKVLENYDAFASTEIKFNPSLSIRSGYRYSFQSNFENQQASSLGIKYVIENKGIEWRASLGKSFRTPTFEELYSKMIFDGHFFTGNENLIPEKSTSYEVNFKKSTLIIPKINLSNSFSASFLQVKDRIDMVLIQFNNDTGNPEYQYININKYRMWNLSTIHQLKNENWSFSVGAALIGISQSIKTKIAQPSDKFLYSLNLNSSISYTLQPWKTTFTAYYKFNGRTQQFVAGSSEYELSTIDESNWIDASLRKTFLKKKIEATIGVRNIANLTNVNQTKSNTSSAHTSASEIMLAYGRSYFFKLAYNLNF